MTPCILDDTIHVVLASDANYAMPLSVALCSTAANCDRQRHLVFHVLYSGIGEELQDKVERSLEASGLRARIHWIGAPLERLSRLKPAHPWTTSLTFARLLIPELLPGEVKRALYLDCDVVVNEDVGLLWDMDFDDKAVFAVRDEIGNVSHPKGLRNYRDLGIPPDAHYFNAGVLLLNLEKWRQRGTGEVVLEYLRTRGSIIQLADQEALNAVLWNDWVELDYCWNWQIRWRHYRLGRATPQWEPPPSKKSIVHFTCAEKPWLPGCDYPEKEYFFRYLDRTEWSGWRVPLIAEISGRATRMLGEARDAVGRMRRSML